ncbi:hypothetical protein [Pseudomonas costantinii]|uniref:hypothetical protein n=1 Tax=Pseudomonas costantinii TaxID=168469 RepID=UPI0015A02D15|nr:hypothetical protein [Pseudomonas costantinii]NVZ70463.1 hypothetical protein [Pseudomonas costantinii]
MRIVLSPQCSGYFEKLKLSKSGDKLTLNGEAFDFSPLREGSILPESAIQSDYFAGPVTRLNGEIQMTLIFPFDGGNDAPEHVRFPEALVVTADGNIKLPGDK